MTGKLFVTGMVRSGTTLISRSLDAHPQVACALSPALGLFRAVRNELEYQQYGRSPDPEAPFTDFFFALKPDLEMFLQADFNLPVTVETLEVIRERLHHYSRDNSPLLAPELARLGSRQTRQTYSGLLEELLGLLREVYGTVQSSWVGFVQNWVEGFVPLWFNTWPDSICVHILRDPRAVLASWLAAPPLELRHDYPLLMMLRHWRKSAALASLFRRRFGGSYLVWRYEDFVQNPEALLADFCRRAGLDFSPSMVETARFSDGGGQNWQSNTSYRDKPQEISPRFLDKWRERLPEKDLQFIEDVCAPEMERWGYARLTPTGVPASLLKVPDLCRRISGASDWMEHYAGEYDPHPLNCAKELYRWYLWAHPEVARSLASREQESVFIDPELVAGLKHPTLRTVE